MLIEIFSRWPFICISILKIIKKKKSRHFLVAFAASFSCIAAIAGMMNAINAFFLFKLKFFLWNWTIIMRDICNYYYRHERLFWKFLILASLPIYMWMSECMWAMPFSFGHYLCISGLIWPGQVIIIMKNWLCLANPINTQWHIDFQRDHPSARPFMGKSNLRSINNSVVIFLSARCGGRWPDAGVIEVFVEWYQSIPSTKFTHTHIHTAGHSEKRLQSINFMDVQNAKSQSMGQLIGQRLTVRVGH